MPIGGGAAGFGGAAGGTGVPLSDPIRTSFAPASELTTVYFGFDSFEITGEARAALDKNANWIRNNPGIHVQIEGHADERGTLEYNLNLGQLRADMVREYLVSAGIEATRLHPISYGEERPQDTSGTERGHQLNRRVQFLVFDPNVMP
jgi:peptidoglycan-associated lipoprotein